MEKRLSRLDRLRQDMAAYRPKPPSDKPRGTQGGALQKQTGVLPTGARTISDKAAEAIAGALRAFLNEGSK